MFITIPKVFESMGFGTAVGILFFLLVLFAAADKFYRIDRECSIYI